MKLSKYLTSMPAYSPAPNTYKVKLNTNAVSYTHLTLPTICSV